MRYIPGAIHPAYDIPAVRKSTAICPVWVHFGAGNLFRAYIAVLADELLEKGLTDKGVIAAEAFDPEIITAAFRPYDNQTLVVTLCADGTVKRRVSASVTEALTPGARLSEIFEKPSLQMVSLTVTEKGYQGPVMELLAGLLFERYSAGGAPLALVSMDNCSGNGDILRSGVLDAARGYENQGFTAYLSDPARISFPWTMIDKITPAPDGPQTAVTAKGTVVAPFVNTEEPQYLVIEDAFPNGRPPLEEAGVYFSDRQTVKKAERMKVTACLNPLHTALAVFGCLFRIETIAGCMKDVDLAELARRLGYDEGLPAVEPPGIFEPRAFLDEVITKRLTNPFLPDTPGRIAADTSKKMAFRLGETVKTYAARDDLSVDSLYAVPLVAAGWVRYLLATGDDGLPMECSPDPLLPRLREELKGVRFGAPETAGNARAVFSGTDIFGCDLYAQGLGKRCEQYLAAMLEGPGAARETLRKVSAGRI